uniref:Bm14372 n=1 Tax=Brugia malayi TaxID=6279 RepID=A0A1I9G6K0_BRUMA|nr:Bm14372 [Brugia malayi]
MLERTFAKWITTFSNAQQTSDNQEEKTRNEEKAGYPVIFDASIQGLYR